MRFREMLMYLLSRCEQTLTQREAFTFLAKGCERQARSSHILGIDGCTIKLTDNGKLVAKLLEKKFTRDKELGKHKIAF